MTCRIPLKSQKSGIETSFRHLLWGFLGPSSRISTSLGPILSEPSQKKSFVKLHTFLHVALSPTRYMDPNAQLLKYIPLSRRSHFDPTNPSLSVMMVPRRPTFVKSPSGKMQSYQLQGMRGSYYVGKVAYVAVNRTDPEKSLYRVHYEDDEAWDISFPELLNGLQAYQDQSSVGQLITGRMYVEEREAKRQKKEQAIKELKRAREEEKQAEEQAKKKREEREALERAIHLED